MKVISEVLWKMGCFDRKILPLILALSLIVGCTNERVENVTTVTPEQINKMPAQADNSDIKSKVMDKLVGHQITYYNIAGKPVIFNVTSDDIQSIEKVSLNGKTVWKVRVGKGLAWDIYFDSQGDEIIKEDQLFVT